MTTAGSFSRLWDEDESGFVLVFDEVAVDAVVAGIELPPDEPLPERRVGSVEGFAPGLVPIEKVGVVVETFRKMFSLNLFTKRDRQEWPER